MSDTTEFWEGDAGDAYHQRNQVDWALRTNFWFDMISRTGARSYLEFGCGPGWNLTAIKNEWDQAYVSGVEINDEARYQAQDAGLDVTEFLVHSRNAEMVFTAGCLIHIPTPGLEDVMRGIINHSYRWVLAIEYEAMEEEEIEYQGEWGLLWKRPYGTLYKDLGLKCIHTEIVGKEHGFDNCRAWLMEK